MVRRCPLLRLSPTAFLLLSLVGTPSARVGAQSTIPAPGTCDTGSNHNADCRMSMTLTSTIVATRRLVVTPGTAFSLFPASGALTATDYDAGQFDASGSLGLLAQSNAPWRVTVQAASANMAGACSSKSATSIRWGLTAATRTNVVTTTAATVISSGTFSTGQTQNVFLRVAIGWLTDAPVADANCTLPLNFTITAP